MTQQMLDHDTLLAAVHARTRSLGIGTAADYLRELDVCLGGGCPSRLLEGVTARQWRAWWRAARWKLVYHHPEMRPLTAMRAAGPRDNSAGPNTHDFGYASDAAGLGQLPPHTIGTFPAVITTTRQDRDGDVLETRGAELDPSAPLLWQHLPDLPIGRLLAEGPRTNARLTGSFAIAGTALGQDAALLAEHGALRISHGFLPTAWEPLDSQDPLAGYHILSFKILEVSLVSVPSNPDAVIEAFSRNKLAHPLIKAWAGARFAARPTSVAVLQQAAGNNANAVLEPFELKAPEVNAMPATMEPKAGRMFSAVNEKRLRAAAFHFKAIEHHDDAVGDVADLARRACVPLDDMLEQLDAGAGTNSGGKAGRAVSAKSADAIAQAIEGGEAIAGHPRATPALCTLATEAVGHLRRVLATNAADESDDGDQDLDGDMSYHDGNPAGSAAFGDRLLLAEAQSLVCRMTAYELLTGMALLRSTAGRFTDAALRIERHLAGC
jgi:hypothetical protein